MKTAVSFSNKICTPEVLSELYNTYPEIRYIIDKGSELSGYDLLKTPITDEITKQIAAFAFGACVNELLKNKGVEIFAYTGYSLGEITAIYAANALSLEEAFGIIKIRGRYMQKIVDEDKNDSAFHSNSMHRVCWEFIKEASKEIKRGGDLQFADTNLYSNVSGLRYKKFTYLPDYFRLQMHMPLKWDKLVSTMASEGIDTVYEVGCGKYFLNESNAQNTNINVITINGIDTLKDALK